LPEDPRRDGSFSASGGAAAATFPRQLAKHPRHAMCFSQRIVTSRRASSPTVGTVLGILLALLLAPVSPLLAAPPRAVCTAGDHCQTGSRTVQCCCMDHDNRGSTSAIVPGAVKTVPDVSSLPFVPPDSTSRTVNDAHRAPSDASSVPPSDRLALLSILRI